MPHNYATAKGSRRSGGVSARRNSERATRVRHHPKALSVFARKGIRNIMATLLLKVWFIEPANPATLVNGDKTGLKLEEEDDPLIFCNLL